MKSDRKSFYDHLRSLAALLVLPVALGATAMAQEERPRKALPVDPGLDTTETRSPLPADRPLTSSSKEEDLFNYATLVYEKKYYDIAEQQYDEYLKAYPAGPNAEAAWFRLGESLLKQDKHARAEDCYLTVLKSFKGGSFTASAAYRMASLAYNRSEYKTAEPFFALAGSRTKHDTIRIPALYYRARCLKQLDRVKDSIATYEKVATIEKDNPYREASLLAIARMHTENAAHEDALKYFAVLAKVSTRPAVKGEALFKAGMISSTLRKSEDARAYFEQTLELKEAGEWKAEAQFYLIDSYYREEDYKKVTSAFETGAFSMSEELKPKMLLMVGNAYRHQSRFASAIDIYLDIERFYPRTNEALEGAYRKLLCFFNLKNPNLPAFVDEFIAMQTLRDASNAYIDMALLLKAETSFANNAMGDAARAYDEVRTAKIPENLRASTLYKRGWSHAESHAPAQAIRALTAFIEEYPEDPRVVNALAKRGLSYKGVEDLSGAEKDFRRILDDHKESDVCELAWQQIALIKGQQRDNAGMVAAYQGLIDAYPETAAAAEAHFWIGWGRFELRKFEECLEPLGKAREIDKATFFDRASLRIVLAYRSLEDIANARKEIEVFRKMGGNVAVPPQIYAWLGIRLFEKQDYEGADRYLTLSSTPHSPLDTKAVVWKTLGQTRLHAKKYLAAIEAFDYYLTTDQPNSSRAKVLNEKARSLLALGEHDAADKAIDEGLKIQPQGRVNALLCLTWGDVALARKDYRDALRRLVRPSYVFDDEEITPPALAKSAFAHEKLGEDDKATEIRQKLKVRFPEFKLTAVKSGES